MTRRLPAALAAIACAISESAGREAGEDPGADQDQIERVLAAAGRLATGLQGSGAIIADEALARADIALGRFAAAYRTAFGEHPSETRQRTLSNSGTLSGSN